MRAKDLLYGKNTMTWEEALDYSTAALASPVLTIGSGVAVGALTRNPALGMRVASSGAFLLEGIDEWSQSFDYYLDKGYSAENASRMSHANALMYGALAYFTERLPASRFIKGANKIGIKSKIWDGLVKRTGRYADDLFAKSPNLKLAVTNRGTRLIKTAAMNSGAEGLQEGLQLTFQTGIQYGYKGNEAFEGYGSELRESMRAGSLAGFLLGPLASGISGVTERMGKEVAEVEASKVTAKDKVKLPVLDKSSLLLAKFTRKTEGLSDADKDALTQIDIQDTKSPGKILAAIKEKGVKILDELNIDPQDITSQLKKIFPNKPEYVSEALKHLKQVPTTTETKESLETPVTEIKDEADAFLASMEAAETELEDTEVDVEVTLPEYESLTKPQLQSRIQDLKDQGIKISKTGTKQQLITRLRDYDTEQETQIDDVEDIIPTLQAQRVFDVELDEQGEPIQQQSDLDTPTTEAPAEVFENQNEQDALKLYYETGRNYPGVNALIKMLVQALRLKDNQKFKL